MKMKNHSIEITFSTEFKMGSLAKLKKPLEARSYKMRSIMQRGVRRKFR